jgi:hypothetical protein
MLRGDRGSGLGGQGELLSRRKWLLGKGDMPSRVLHAPFFSPFSGTGSGLARGRTRPSQTRGMLGQKALAKSLLFHSLLLASTDDEIHVLQHERLGHIANPPRNGLALRARHLRWQW